MIGTLLKFLPQKLLLAIVAALLVALAVVYFGFGLALSNTQQKLDDANASLATATANQKIAEADVATLRAAVQRQNDAIALMEAQAALANERAVGRVRNAIAKQFKPAAGAGAGEMNAWLTNFVTQ